MMYHTKYLEQKEHHSTTEYITWLIIVAEPLRRPGNQNFKHYTINTRKDATQKHIQKMCLVSLQKFIATQ